MSKCKSLSSYFCYTASFCPNFISSFPKTQYFQNVKFSESDQA